MYDVMSVIQSSSHSWNSYVGEGHNTVHDLDLCSGSYVTLTFIQGHRVQESKHFCTDYLTTFYIDVDGMWHTAETCWSNEPFHLVYSVFKSENPAYVISSTHKKSPLGWPAFRRIFFFKLVLMIGTTEIYVLISVLMSLTFVQNLLSPLPHRFPKRFL